MSTGDNGQLPDGSRHCPDGFGQLLVGPVYLCPFLELAYRLLLVSCDQFEPCPQTDSTNDDTALSNSLLIHDFEIFNALVVVDEFNNFTSK